MKIRLRENRVSMKARVFTTVLFALFSFSASAATDSTIGKDGENLRVMSYNIWYAFAKGKQVEAGKKWIRSRKPDVVALQELTSIRPEKLQDFDNFFGLSSKVGTRIWFS